MCIEKKELKKGQLRKKIANLDAEFKIAIDGYSGVGKGLISSILAQEFALTYVESSIIYRGLAFFLQQEKIDLDNNQAIIELVNSKDIIKETQKADLRNEDVGLVASKIAIIPEVREKITSYLRSIIQRTPRIIMEGRDIGTVIAPQAELKFFLIADLTIRAKRRYKQLQLTGKEYSLNDILESLKQRDLRDKTRELAPLKPAKDALIIDTSYLSPAEVIAKIKEVFY